MIAVAWGGGGFGGEEGVGVEGGFLAADAAEVELVAAHGDADAAFDLGGELGEEVAAFGGGEDGAMAEVGHVGVGEGVELGVEGEEVGLDGGDLGEGAGELGGGFVGGGGEVVAVQHAVEEVGVGAEEGFVGLGHEVGAVALVAGIASEVGVDALGDFAEESS